LRPPCRRPTTWRRDACPGNYATNPAFGARGGSPVSDSSDGVPDDKGETAARAERHPCARDFSAAGLVSTIEGSSAVSNPSKQSVNGHRRMGPRAPPRRNTSRSNTGRNASEMLMPAYRPGCANRHARSDHPRARRLQGRRLADGTRSTFEHGPRLGR
jgi:hypothetical protein